MTDTALVGEIVQTFFAKGRGRVLVVDVDSPPAGLGQGDPVEIRWPEGRVLEVRLGAVELAAGQYESTIGLYLPRELDSLEVPVGAKIWKSS
jgi:hypothetical protein